MDNSISKGYKLGVDRLKGKSSFEMVMDIIIWTIALSLLFSFFLLIADMVVGLVVVAFTTVNGALALLMLFGFLYWKFSAKFKGLFLKYKTEG